MVESTGKIGATSKTGGTNKKRLSKGQRKHLRRTKSEARKAVTTTHG